MAKLKVAVNISRKWVIGIGLSLTLGSGIAAIQPNGFLLFRFKQVIALSYEKCR